MCGIVGFVDKRRIYSKEQQQEIISGMISLVQHRGGDSIGVYSDDNVALGHTRLAIVDTTSKGKQPYENVRGTLTFNGEIYNHLKLRDEYFKHDTFNSSSDTATLFKLLTKNGYETALTKIKGIFAFAYLDNEYHNLYLTVDHYGVKPLYYYDSPEYFAFSSEIKAFKALPDMKFEFNSDVLAEYMTFRYIAGPRTLFKNIYRVLPGQSVTYSLDSNAYANSFYNSFLASHGDVPFNEDLIENAVKENLMGDTGVGIQLSGGVDSSLIAYYASKHSTESIHTFSIGMEENEWNEFPYSDEVSRLINSIHHQILFTKKDFANLFEEITYFLDEPIVHPNTVPMFILAKEARKYTKMLLTGEGADEIFSGYARYLHTIVENDEDVIFSNAFLRKEDIVVLKKQFIPDDLLKERKLILENEKIQTVTSKQKMGMYDMLTYLPHVLLRQDKAGMAANVENRVPFLSDEIVVSRLPTFASNSDDGGKRILKDIALKYFSKNLVLRRKCGFGLPINEWLRDQDVLLPYLNECKSSIFIAKYFDTSIIDKLIKDHLNGEDNSRILFTLVSLDVWYKKFFG